jgi:hypothetical protein
MSKMLKVALVTAAALSLASPVIAAKDKPAAAPKASSCVVDGGQGQMWPCSVGGES